MPLHSVASPPRLRKNQRRSAKPVILSGAKDLNEILRRLRLLRMTRGRTEWARPAFLTRRKRKSKTVSRLETDQGDEPADSHLRDVGALPPPSGEVPQCSHWGGRGRRVTPSVTVRCANRDSSPKGGAGGRNADLANFSRKKLLQNRKKHLQSLANSAKMLFCEAARRAIREDR